MLSYGMVWYGMELKVLLQMKSLTVISTTGRKKILLFGENWPKEISRKYLGLSISLTILFA